MKMMQKRNSKQEWVFLPRWGDFWIMEEQEGSLKMIRPSPLPGERPAETAERLLQTEMSVFPVRLSGTKNSRPTLYLLYPKKEPVLSSAMVKVRIPKTLDMAEKALYHEAQAWINLQCSGDEQWDLMDAERNPLGKTQFRRNPVRPGEYHLTVHVWVRDSEGRYLITCRTANKGYPFLWETSGGSAQAGDSSLEAALREVREETGLRLPPEKGRLFTTVRYTETFCDVWLFDWDYRMTEIRLQEGETCDARRVTPEEIRRLQQEQEMIAYPYQEELFRTAEKSTEP